MENSGQPLFQGDTMSGGGTTPAKTDQVSKVELPEWVNQASQSNYKLATDIANRPLEQYQGQQVAAPGALTTQGLGLIGSSAGATNPLYKQAGDVYGSTTGDLDINKYLNPYTNEVEKRSIANANTALDQRLLQTTDAARQAGAFGGSRHGIQSGVTAAEGVRGIGDLSALLRKQGIDFATQTAISDRAGRQAGAAGLLGTAAGQQAATQTDISNLLSGGAQQKQQAQQEIDAAMKQFYEKRDYPIEGLNTRLAALGMSPYGKTETTNKTATSEDKGPDWASILLGAGKIGAQLYTGSDRNLKTDIEKITDGDIPLYAYRYKTDPKTYPKVIGPMAQDIEKVHPSAVKKVGKHKIVNLTNLMEVLA